MPKERKPVEGSPNETDGTYTKTFWFTREHYSNKEINYYGTYVKALETNIVACATELLVRWYLKCCKFKYVSALKSTSMDDWLEQHFGMNWEDISIDFVKERNKLADTILKSVEERNGTTHIEIVMELGKPLNDKELKELACHWNENEEKIYSRIKELFTVLTEAQIVGLVHLDLKPGNLLSVTRNGREWGEEWGVEEWDEEWKDVWVLNDMDSALILNPERQRKTYRADSTLGYAAMEQIGVNDADYELNNEKIGCYTDVFAASVIAYRMLNYGIFPPGLTGLPQKKLEGELFIKGNDQDKRDEYGFKLPANGNPEIKDIIMTGLTVNFEKRPTAAAMLTHLKAMPLRPFNWYHEAVPVESEVVPIEPEEDPSEDEKRMRSRRIKNNILLIAAACLLLGVLVWKPLMQMLSASQKPANGQAEAQTSAVVSETQPPAGTKISTEPLITTVQTEDTAVTQTDPPEATTVPVTEDSSKGNGTKKGVENNESGGGGVVYPPDDAPADRSESQQETEESASETESPFVWEEVSYDIRNTDTGDYETLTGLEIRDCRDFAGGTLTIPDEIGGKSVIAIGASAFQTLRNRITALELPESVVFIGENAFADSFDGESLNLYFVRHIGARAFYNSGSLRKIELSPRLAHIGDYAFSEDAPSDEREIIYNMNSSKWRNLVDKGASPLGSEGLFNEPPLF